MTASIAVSRVPAEAYGERHADAFADLCRRAQAPNLHMAPAAVAAAIGFGIAPADVVVLAARAAGEPSLLGVWVLHRLRSLRTGLAQVLSAPLVPLYEISSAPVLDAQRAGDVAEALLRSIIAASDLPQILALPLLPMDGAPCEALAAALAATGSRLATFDRWLRPMALPQPGDDAERYLRRSLGQGYKKRMQQYRQLEKAGALAFERHRGRDAIAALDALLALEAAGWKGRAGSALAGLPRDAAYIRDIVSGFAANDAVRIDLLRLDGHLIAGGLLLEQAGQSHFLKIAYDESRAKLSPGRALAIAMLQADFAGGPPVRLDSGAGDRVDPAAYPWGERQAMAHAVIGLAGRTAALPRLAAAARMRLRGWRDRTDA